MDILNILKKQRYLDEKSQIDWLLVFNAQAAKFQLYPGDEHEMDE